MTPDSAEFAMFLLCTIGLGSTPLIGCISARSHEWPGVLLALTGLSLSIAGLHSLIGGCP